MKNTKLYSGFNFNTIRLTKYHYTDNRAGAPYNYIAYMVKGTAKIVGKSNTILVAEGDIFYIPKNLSYQSYWYGDEIKFISIGFSELETREFAKFKLQTIPHNKEIINKITAIPTNGADISCKDLCLFYDMASRIIPRLEYSTDNNETIIVNNIKEFIKGNPFCSLSEIARMCMVSEPHMYSVFKRITKRTPNEYRQIVLCEMATKLLLTTDKPVEEISSTLNFSSSSYFRKILKKHTGLTPREIRKNQIL